MAEKEKFLKLYGDKSAAVMVSAIATIGGLLGGHLMWAGAVQSDFEGLAQENSSLKTREYRDGIHALNAERYAELDKVVKNLNATYDDYRKVEEENDRMMAELAGRLWSDKAVSEDDVEGLLYDASWGGRPKADLLPKMTMNQIEECRAVISGDGKSYDVAMKIAQCSNERSLDGNLYSALGGGATGLGMALLAPFLMAARRRKDEGPETKPQAAVVAQEPVKAKAGFSLD